MENIIIIPSYEPDQKIMLKFINELKKEFKNIIIVNDGSSKKHDEFFLGFEKQNIIVLKHYVNLGKGRAIKTAFNYIGNNFEDFDCTITADCDGQHTVEDIKRCIQASKEHPTSLILGVRDIKQKDVPFKSKLGNKIMINIFKLLLGLKITDTQTGLRGFNKKLVQLFIKTTGERYEYETNMLIDCKLYDIDIKEVKIKTIYINNNKGSYYRPIKDSLIIFKLFIKYILVALSSFAIDITIFTILVKLLGYRIDNSILIATIIARIISSLYNFLTNAKLVFKKMNKTSLVKYYLLVGIQMLISGYSVSYLYKVFAKISYVVIKIVVDFLIFIINFIIQRDWIFLEEK